MQTRWPVHGDEEVEAVARVLRSGKTNYWTGEEGQAFEREWAAYTGAQYALAVSNGTTALEVAIRSLRLTPGSELVIPCRTFMACASAVVNCGLVPILADIDHETLNVSVATLSARASTSTSAVMAVHWGGLPVDIEAICLWAREKNLRVIEDCSHAHGARVGGKHVGTFGDVGTFSFCVGKIMSTGGEGGVVVTNSTEIYRRSSAYRDHGRYQLSGSRDFSKFEYSVQEFGSNLRITEMQSAIARCQLRKLDGWVMRRRDIGRRYDAAFGWNVCRDNHALYLYTGRVMDREEKLQALNDVGVPARLNGCPNLYGEPAFEKHYAAPCPVADRVGKETLGLPIYPTLTDSDVEEIIEKSLPILKG